LPPRVAAQPELDGMGTTLTAILFSATIFGLAYVGDSRAYLLRAQELTRLTRDDSLVADGTEQGPHHPEQAHTEDRAALAAIDDAGASALGRAFHGVAVSSTIW
jgi:serine/threonine protein phosphatase PrpC